MHAHIFFCRQGFDSWKNQDYTWKGSKSVQESGKFVSKKSLWTSYYFVYSGCANEGALSRNYCFSSFFFSLTFFSEEECFWKKKGNILLLGSQVCFFQMAACVHKTVFFSEKRTGFARNNRPLAIKRLTLADWLIRPGCTSLFSQ